MTRPALMMIPMLLPILMGVIILLLPKKTGHKSLCIWTAVSLMLSAAPAVAVCAVAGTETEFTLFYLTSSMPVYFKIDNVGRLFVIVATAVWLLSGLNAFSYMKGDSGEKMFYGFYLIVYGVLVALGFCGNLITFYICYELMTLTSAPMVLHNRTREAVMAGLKYLLYSLAGAYMVLFGIFFLNRYADTLTFTAGGVLSAGMISGHETFMLVVAFVMILGFGVKAGMFPMHGWLPVAHPEAPAPASAVLSGVIVKAGVLGIIRTVYYIFGTEFLRGTWVQTAWIVLILITILLGSTLAYHEKIWKKRMAYSTVSQASYILFGLALMTPAGFQGALLHLVFHAFIKSGLFLTAGAMIHHTGKTRVDEYKGLGREMPITMISYTCLALALIGIPPAAGFISKWYLASGALDFSAVQGWLGIAGIVVLLISAVLTAAYLLPISIDAFLGTPDEPALAEPVEEGHGQKAGRLEADWQMVLPIAILGVAAILLGIFSNGLIQFVGEIAQIVMP